MRPKAIFFDAGNTLFFFNTPFFKQELERVGVILDALRFDLAHPKAIANLNRLTKIIDDDEERYRVSHFFWFEEGGMEKADRAKALEILRTHPERHLFWSLLPAEIHKTLHQLKSAGVKLGIISNAEGQIRALVRHLGLDSIFDVVIDSYEVQVAKPDPKIFEIALERIGATAKESWHVGDMVETDIVGARAAGLTPILYDSHRLYPEIKDCRRITQFSTLLEMV